MTQAPVIAAIIAGFVAVAGWIVSYSLTSAANRKNLAETGALKHIECQLEELYGPLAFLVWEGRETFAELTRSLGRDYIFDENDQISNEDLKTWLFWVENDFLPRNKKIKDLLSKKTHLMELEGSKVPASYTAFLNHHNSWMIRHLRWKKEGVAYSWHSATNWPERFEEDVLDTFQRLQIEHSSRLGKVSQASGRSA